MKPALMLNAASLKPLDTAELDAPTATSVRNRPLKRSEQSTRSIRPSLAPAAVLPDERDRVATPSTRTRRPQLASLPRSASARVAFAPVRTESTLNGDGSLRAARSSRTRATSPPRSSTRRVRPQLEPGPATLPSEPDSHPPRASRAQRTPTAPMREARSASRVSFAAATRVPEASATRESSLPRSRRAELVNKPGSRQRAGTEGAGLSGVPLAELASCVTDREEARLKQRVLAAVTSQEKCASPAGSYRFVETKNLNAFLMWIERAPGQPGGDRCVALRNALACLESNP